MKTFRIEKTQSDYGSESFSVHHQYGVSGWLCRDEAIGCVAEILYARGRLPDSPERMDALVWSLSVEEVERGVWNISDDAGRFSGPLTDAECLYFIACLIMGSSAPFGGLQSYVERTRGRDWLNQRPVALLEVKL